MKWQVPHHNMYVGILLLVLLQALDDALRIGVPPAAITELVGPATVGKSQFCYTLALQVRHCGCTGVWDTYAVAVAILCLFL
jgi:RecA/RadA recombinase